MKHPYTLGLSCISTAALCLAACGIAQTDTAFAEPTALVAEYAVRDTSGEFRRHSAWLQAVTTWEDAPGWDMSTVVTSYHVTPLTLSDSTATVEVNYLVAGSIYATGDEGRVYRFDPAAQSELDTFHLIRQSGKWRIRHPQLQPHISPSDALRGYGAVFDGESLNRVRALAQGSP